MEYKFIGIKPNIGDVYTYPNRKQKFEVVNVTDYSVRFKCGHKVTDCVLLDMVPVSRKVNQLELF